MSKHKHGDERCQPPAQACGCGCDSSAETGPNSATAQQQGCATEVRPEEITAACCSHTHAPKTDESGCGCGDHHHDAQHEHHHHAHTHDDCHHEQHSHAGACGCGCSHEHDAVSETAAGAALTQLPAHLQQFVFDITGLDCPDCARKLADVVGKQPGIVSSRLSYATSRLQVVAERGSHPQAIAAVVRQLGYQASLRGESQQRQLRQLRVFGLDCGDCAAKLEVQAQRLPGVESFQLNFGAGVATFAPAEAAPQLIAAIERSGYRAELLGEPLSTVSKAASPSWQFWLKNRRAILTVISGVWLALGWILHLGGADKQLVHGLFLLTMLTGGYYVARSGLYALRNKSLDMNFLMTVAAIGAVAIGEWEEGAMVVFLFSLGNTLQAYTMDKTRQSIRSLMDLAPKVALVKRSGMEMMLPTQEILLGDSLVVRPGERVAMDGVVVDGSSAINQAPITGESLPVEKAEGDRVFAGTINGQGSLEVRVDRLVEDNTLSRIMHLVEVAQSERAPAQELVDRFARYYTPIVILLAIAVAVFPPLMGAEFAVWFKRALILLVISCPCALVISTPVSIVSAIGTASRQGVLIKGGAYLEAMGKIRTIAFDKTGTLTQGQLVLTDVQAFIGGELGLLERAAALEKRSEHPLGAAIVRAAEQRNLSVTAAPDFQALTGLGAKGTVRGQTLYIGSERLLRERSHELNAEQQALVERLQAEGKTVVYLMDESRVLGLLALADVLRPHVQETVRELKQAGIEKVAMLTGDHTRTAAAINKQLGLDESQAELLPEDKVAAIRRLLDRYEQVAMVGDGVNDAPALATASVGIALGVAGTDTAIETADIALMSDDLRKLPFLIKLSRQTVAIIKQNIVFSIAVKALVLLLTGLGHAELWMAVFADTGAALIVIFNGMRLLRVRAAAK